MNNFQSADPDQMRLQYKIILMGDGGVGKTALVRRSCFDDFSINSQPTIGLSFNSYTLQAKQNELKFQIGLSIWDFGGQERFRPLLPQFISGADAALLVFDLSNPLTLEHLSEWYTLLLANTENVAIELVGAKSDLIEENPEFMVDSEMINQYLKDFGAQFYCETSAKKAKNTDKIFSLIVQAMVDKESPDEHIIIA